MDVAKANLPGSIIQEQLKAQEAVKKLLLPDKRLFEMAEAHKAWVIRAQTAVDQLKDLVIRPDAIARMPKYTEMASRMSDEMRKFTEFPRPEIVEMIEKIRSRELAFAKIHERSLRPIIEAAARANDRISELARVCQPTYELTERLRLAALGELDGSWKARIAGMAAVSRSIQETLENLERGAVGRALFFSEDWHRRLTGSLSAVALNFDSLWAELRLRDASLSAIDPVILEAPPTEFYQATKLLKSFYRDTRRYRSEEAELILDEAEDKLETQLRELDEDLLGLYRGAKTALAKRGSPDRTRHFAVSLRELLTHVLHMLSPDEKFHAWNKDQTLVDNGKPTRRGRLLYICRSVNHGPFSDFVGADVDAVLEFIDLFHEGTHAVKPAFSEKQLRAMLKRAEGLLSYLVDIGSKSRS